MKNQFHTRSDTNEAARPKSIARRLKFETIIKNNIGALKNELISVRINQNAGSTCHLTYSNQSAFGRNPEKVV